MKIPRVWRSIKIPEETYVKIIMIKANLERYNKQRISLWETVDLIFSEVVKEVERTKPKPPKKIKITYD